MEEGSFYTPGAYIYKSTCAQGKTHELEPVVCGKAEYSLGHAERNERDEKICRLGYNVGSAVVCGAHISGVEPDHEKHHQLRAEVPKLMSAVLAASVLYLSPAAACVLTAYAQRRPAYSSVLSS